MPGKISLLVNEGDTVSKDDVVLKMEALKMEMDVVSPSDDLL